MDYCLFGVTGVYYSHDTPTVRYVAKWTGNIEFITTLYAMLCSGYKTDSERTCGFRHGIRAFRHPKGVFFDFYFGVRKDEYTTCTVRDGMCAQKRSENRAMCYLSAAQAAVDMDHCSNTEHADISQCSRTRTGLLYIVGT